MQFQLVVQFRPIEACGFGKLESIEEALISELGDFALVDGHDIGAREFNIFILTNNPTASFQRIQKLLQFLKPDGAMNVAYRETGKEEYLVLWSPGLTEFKIT